MFEDRADVAEADEDGGGGDEKYEINSMGKPSGTGLLEMVAMVSQHTGQGLYEQVVNETLWKIIKRTTRRNV